MGNLARMGKPRTAASTLRSQRVPGETEVLDDLATDQVLLNDSLDILRGDILVPRPFRIDDTNGPGSADPQALALGAVAWPVRPGEVQLLEPLLEILPGFLSGLGIDAIGPEADEQVSRQLPYAEFRRHHRRR